MTMKNISNDEFEVVELYQKQHVLFAPYRVDRNTIPAGLHVYECRHGDHIDHLGKCADYPLFEEICDNVYVNFFGTIISKENILNGNKSRMVTFADINFVGDFMTVTDYEIHKFTEEEY